MIVAFHSVLNNFFKSNPPYGEKELFSLIREAASLGFKCFQVGPLRNFVEIDGKLLKKTLDEYGMERNVHIGGLYDAEKLPLTEEEYERVQKEIHYGIKLCQEINSPLASFHPPFFAIKDFDNKAILSKVRKRFHELVNEGVEYAYKKGIRMALESYCYRPFIFLDLPDFMEFVLSFPSTKLGVLLEVGHLYQAKFNLDEAIRMFKNRLFEVHIHDATLQEDYQKATHLPLGKGSIEFSQLLTTLLNAKFDGWLTLEVKGNKREVFESKQVLENLIKEAVINNS